MKIINLIQGTPKWHAWRRSKITATAAGVIMGNNPFKSVKDLWNEIMGITPPTETNDAMRRGTELEPAARMLFEEMMGIEFPPICVESDDNYWMGASLDGYNEDNAAVLEIKCPGERTHVDALCEIVPLYYRDQIMHQLSITGAKIAYYVSYRPENHTKIAVVEIKPDAEYMAALVEAERKFYFENVCAFKEPEEWTIKLKPQQKQNLV